LALRLRTARPADAPAIAAIQTASWQDTYRGLLPDAFLDAALAALLLTRWEDALGGRRRPGAVILATAGGAAAGFVAAWREGANAHVDNLHVRPGMRSAGIGRALLGFAAFRLMQMGCDTADLWVLTGNGDGLRFYTRLGGVVVQQQNRPAQGQMVPQTRVAWADIQTLVTACSAR
jgi:hypothetical protein